MITVQLGGKPVTIHVGEAVHPPTELLGLDVESTYMTDRGQWDDDFHVRLVQVATEDEGWVFDLANRAERTMVEAMLLDPTVSFCSHTNMDVLSVWAEFGIDISARNVDTRMLAIQADPDKDDDRDLKTLATKYGMPELAEADRELMTWMRERYVEDGKGKRNAAVKAVEEYGWNLLAAMPAEEWPEVYTRYAGLDAIVCRRLAPLLVPETQAPPELIRVDHWLQVRTNRQQMAGKIIDTEAHAVMLAESTAETSGAKARAMELTDGINIGGPKIQPWLAEHGVDWESWPGSWTKDDNGKPRNPSLEKDNILLLRQYPLDEVGSAVVDEMIRFRKHQDLWNKCRDIERRLVLHSDGIHRIHPQVNPIGASTTARMSSSGPNVQNFSKKDPRMRGLFLPDPGYTFVTIDFDQVELRVVAALAREEKMIEVILAGGDLHQLTVDLLAGMGVEIDRDTGKMGNFLIVYGGGGQALHDQGGIPLDIAWDVVRGMREGYPSIDAYSKWMAMEKTAIRTVSNRRLPVTRVKGSGERAGDIRAYANINYAVQSAAREVLASSWMTLEDGHSRPGIVWLPVHDELVLMVPDDEVDAVIADAEESMTMDFRGVPITASAVVLRDENGVSRWMTGKHSEAIQKEKAA